MADPGFHSLRVSEVVSETSDTRSLVFEVPQELAERYAYRPGQFVTLRIPDSNGGSVARCYSLSSSPAHDGELKVTVKRVQDGYGSNWICDNVTAGTTVDILPPSGAFTPRSADEDLLLFAGGSGITPVISIIKSTLAGGRGRLVLVYANQDEDSVIFGSELRRLSADHPDRLVVIHWLESVQGLPSTAQLLALATPFAEYEAFVCGPGPFMDAATEALGELGVPRKRVHVERFVSLTENPFEDAPSAETERPETQEEDQDAATVEVELDGQHHRFRWPAGTKLLDLLLENGLDAPFSCREGSCSACACWIQEGDVKLLRNEVLDQQDLDEGIILACQALPVTPEIRITYE
jgi:3-ketosteroid 9alpha-monooxygenase subunit B